MVPNVSTDELESLFTSWTLAIENRQRIEATARTMDWAAERSALNGAHGGTTAVDIGLDTELNFALVTEKEAAFAFRAAVRACKIGGKPAQLIRAEKLPWPQSQRVFP